MRGIAEIRAGSITFESLLTMSLMASACTIAMIEIISQSCAKRESSAELLCEARYLSLAAHSGDAMRRAIAAKADVPLSTTAAIAEIDHQTGDVDQRRDERALTRSPGRNPNRAR